MTDRCIDVLIIEDNPGDARLVQEALKGMSDPAYRVKCLERLSDGLTVLAEGGVDVVLLDLGLPDSQGLTGLTRIQAAAPTVPVVVLSGGDDEQLAVEAVHAGAQDYLVKGDATSHVLMRSLRYAIERKAADEALRGNEERLRMAISAANEGIWEYHPVTGFVRWNEFDGEDSNAGVTGPVAELWNGRIHAEDSQRVFKSFFETLEGPALTWCAEYRLLRAGGEWSYIRDRAIITRNGAGKAIRVVGAMIDITEINRAGEALRESNGRLQRLSRDLLRAQDYERRRIARELHDSTSQILTALSINLSRLEAPEMEPDRRRQVLSDTKELAAACFAEIRTVTYLLHPPLLDELGLASALHSYAQGFNDRTGIHVEVKIPPDFGRLSNEMEATLFRIAQEGLANVHRHSGSPLAVIRLEREVDKVRLTLQDRGRGLPKVAHGQSKGFVRFGIGITGMRERAEQLGGRLELTSNDTGTKLAVTLPWVKPS